MDLEGIGIGADGMSGDSIVSFVCCRIIPGSLQLESPQFLFVSKISADVFLSNTRLCFAPSHADGSFSP
jgi:hypothetical protein